MGLHWHDSFIVLFIYSKSFVNIIFSPCWFFRQQETEYDLSSGPQTHNLLKSGAVRLSSTSNPIPTESKSCIKIALLPTKKKNMWRSFPMELKLLQKSGDWKPAVGCSLNWNPECGSKKWNTKLEYLMRYAKIASVVSFLLWQKER